MLTCPACGRWASDQSRHCTHCGSRLTDSQQIHPTSRRADETLCLPVLYAMVVALLLALVVPPWEAPLDQPPEFLGFHAFGNPPRPDAVVSRMLLTIELSTIAVAGLYFSWLFRKK